ncbi:substrate-binding domain-containing protein [uncultured Ruminococcus sp.]|uniref:substrate-binding domain-containing protein n=1 Tax=uncultured Ruminococcus sp. TaxID=165186 RepID=UPI0025EB0474|nr:substrate-binding domain-containing protein [uncultured Ruminococcus sp.]
MNAVGKIGVIAPPVTHALIADALDGIDRTARAAGYDVVVFTCSTNPKQPYSKVRDPFYIHHISGEKEIYDLAVRADLDGYIIMGDCFFDQQFVEELLRQFHQRGARCVVMEKANKLYPYVYAEQRKVLYSLTEHLIQVHGCRRLYCLTGPQERFEARERRDGFVQAALDNGIPVSEADIFYGNFWMDSAKELAQRILEGTIPKPDGVVCASDMMAIALCDALQAGGISVPGEIAVIGYDGTMQALIHEPPVTTVGGCERQAGQKAVELLLEQLGRQKVCKPLEPVLLLGGSCGCPVAPEVAVAAVEQSHTITEQQMLTEAHMNANHIVRLSNAADVQELQLRISETVYLVPRWTEIDVCVCSGWLGKFQQSQAYQLSHYTDRMLLFMGTQYGELAKAGASFPARQILPGLAEPHTPRLVRLTPLHCDQDIYGYCAAVFRHAADCQMDFHYSNWCASVSNGFRMLRSKLYTDFLQKKMARYDTHDMLTGFYNNKGFLQQLPLYAAQGGAGSAVGVLVIQCPRAESTEYVFMLADVLRLLHSGGLNGRLSDSVFAAAFTGDPRELRESMDLWILRMEQALEELKRVSSGRDHANVRYTSCILSDPAQAQEQISACMLEISSRTALSPFRSELQDALEDAQRRIYAFPERDWNIDELCRSIGISRGYFQRNYKSQFGISCGEDIIQARIQRAKKLLADTTLTVQEIADQCGYKTHTHFMRQFKERAGISATQYRKKYAKTI